MQIDGKQIKNTTVADGKMVESYIKADGTRGFSGAVSGATPTLSSHLVTKAYADALLTGKFPITACRLATTVNISLTGTQTIDGVVGVNGDRVLVKNQNTASQNGVFIMASGAWPRSTDYDGSGEVTASDIIPVQEGTANADTAWELSTDGAIVIGTTLLTYSLFAGLKSATISTSNKSMTASVTASDFQVACATTLVAAPNRNGFIEVLINGVLVSLGDAIKTKDCYFSSDGGTTAKAIASLAAGDTLYWVGSVAGYQLAASDVVDFSYSVLL